MTPKPKKDNEVEDFKELVKQQFNKLDINEFLELKEVVKDILPKITPENLGFTEYNEEEDLHAYTSK